MNWKKSVLNSQQRLAIPVMTHPGIEALGYSVKQAVSKGEIHFKAIQYLSEKMPAAAATAIMDLTLEAEAFGATISMPEHEVPSVTGRLVYDYETVEALQIPDLHAGRVPEYLKANQLAVAGIQNKPVLSGCIGPFSLAGRLYDMSEIMLGIYLEPDTIHLLLSKCTEFLKKYCLALKMTGTQGVVMAEPAAGLMSDEDCMQYSTEYVKQIVNAVQDENFAVILHNCGNTGQCTGAMVASGASGLHFGNAINMLQVLNDCPQDVVIMGNLDPVSVFKQGTPASVETSTRELLQQTEAFPNFVISSGCDLPPHVPEANLKAFFEAVEAFNHPA